MKRIHAVVSVVVVLLFTMAACTSRYRLDLFVEHGEFKKRIKVEKTKYMNGGVLSSPWADRKIVNGPGNCVVLITGARGHRIKSASYDLMEYDRYIKYKIFLQMPSRLAPGVLPLKNNSFVQLMGQFELEPEKKMFIAQEGTLTIDSLAGKRLFGTIDGMFANKQGESVLLEGQFKVKFAK
ncbi:MAG: hypothetical protein DRP45_04540 [Candidatus Zixiibacteriota bacterium]|nr:MAG: hypothetical protein DRP45_04540 [candidate division Zixibacteria bacterium]